MVKYIAENYKKHCWSCTSFEVTKLLKIMPLKMIEIDNIRDLKVAINPSALKYIRIAVECKDHMMDVLEHWDFHFDKCDKLERLYVYFYGESYDFEEFLDDLLEEEQEELEKRGISILDAGHWNIIEHLDLAKKSELKWGIHFY